MCGRYALTLPPQAVRQYFGYAEQPNFPPRYNIAPTQPVPVVRITSGAREFALMRWGLLPGWVKDPKAFPLVINVRSETMREKPSFRAAFTRRRCAMPADGFYEWQQLGTEKRPYLFRRPDRGVFAFAALWECWTSPDGSEIDTVALVNGAANGLMSGVHHRCPIILDGDELATWLDPETPPDAAEALCRPPPDDLLEMVRISSAVNKVANDRPEVQAPIVPRAEPGAVASDEAAEKPKSEPDPQGRLF
jgi:putative SOS response-associated peptidase YedK